MEHVGIPNIDPDTLIHYGVISMNSVSDWFMDEIYTGGRNETWEGWKEEVTSVIKDLISDPCPDKQNMIATIGKYGTFDHDLLSQFLEEDIDGEEFVDLVFEDLDQDWEPGGSDTYSFKDDGIEVLTSELGLFVCKSTVYTETKKCSPCCPNAGDLDSYDENGLETYCLPRDYFEEEDPPYDEIFSVDKQSIVWKKHPKEVIRIDNEEVIKCYSSPEKDHFLFLESTGEKMCIYCAYEQVTEDGTDNEVYVIHTITSAEEFTLCGFCGNPVYPAK